MAKKLYKCEYPGCDKETRVRSTIKSGEYRGLKACEYHARIYRDHGTSEQTLRTRAKRKQSREDYPNFYLKMIDLYRGKDCVECGTRLQGNGSEIAHILSKSTNPEVSTDPRNIIPLCLSCHTQFDSNLENRSKMKCFPQTVSQYLTFKDSVTNVSSEYLYYDNLAH